MIYSETWCFGHRHEEGGRGEVLSAGDSVKLRDSHHATQI